MPRRSYPNRPQFIDHPRARQLCETGEVPETSVFDLLMPTMYGLLEDLTPGSAMADEFVQEWSLLEDMMDDDALTARFGYGQWVHYPQANHLVRFAPQKWHQLALLVRNSSLIYPNGPAHDWRGGRARLSKVNIGVCGASVGSNILHAAVMMLRPHAIKVADSKAYQLNNCNRVRLHYSQVDQNKAHVCAEQLHSVDPFSDVYVYPDGILPENVEAFVSGDAAEPALDLVVEETDDPDTKLLVRKWARDKGLPLVMVSDIGAMAQVDVRRFDVDPTLSLTPFVDDDELVASKVATEEDPGNRRKFIAFAKMMSGDHSHTWCSDFWDVLENKVTSEFSGIPQLGSTAQLCGGWASWVISRILLGYPVPERMGVLTHSREFKSWGREL